MTLISVHLSQKKVLYGFWRLEICSGMDYFNDDFMVFYSFSPFILITKKQITNYNTLFIYFFLQRRKYVWDDMRYTYMYVNNGKMLHFGWTIPLNTKNMSIKEIFNLNSLTIYSPPCRSKLCVFLHFAEHKRKYSKECW